MLSLTLRPMLEEKYENLFLVVLKNPDLQEDRFGYKYLISNSFGQSITAFLTEVGMIKYARETGLMMVLRWEDADRSVWNLLGSYRKISYAGNQAMLDQFAEENWLTVTSVLSNGKYTKGYYKPGEIHYLNPNYDREILPSVYL